MKNKGGVSRRDFLSLATLSIGGLISAGFSIPVSTYLLKIEGDQLFIGKLVPAEEVQSN